MARATGVDLTGAADRAELTQADWAAMVQRCRGCTWREGCARWLDVPTDETRTVPASCRNQIKLQNLLEQAQEV